MGLDSLKEFSIGAIVFYIKGNNNINRYKFPPRNLVEPILFLSRLLTPAEIKY